MKTLKLSGWAFIAILFSMTFASCGGENKTENLLEKDYFKIEGATYTSGAIPQDNGNAPIEGINMNTNVLPGGSSYVSIQGEQTYEAFYVSVSGIDGYYTVTPTPYESRDIVIYNFIIMVSQNLANNFVIEVSALLPDGTPTSIFTTEIHYVVAGSGSLQISLSFDQLKDVDLYVIQPDSNIIYYGEKGYWDYDTISGDYVQIWGLDVDSNAGCSIDSINNENVFFPAEYVQNGKYEVWINMYSNCYPRDYATNWVVAAIHEGAMVSTTFGLNPTAGYYPADEESNAIGSSLDGATKVMEFYIDNGSTKLMKNGKPMPLTESAKEKLEMAID